MIRQTTDRAAVVDTSYQWLPIETCPNGSKVQLIGPGGAAYYGNGPDGYAMAWAPLPKKGEWLVQLMERTKWSSTKK